MTQIILLATAESKKLRPLSDELPVPLIPVANRPVMLHTIDMLARQGHKQMLVSLHYQAGMIESFFYTGQRWGISLDYLLQRHPLGDAGALGWAKAHLKTTFLVIPADILIDLNIEQALSEHRHSGSAATIIAHEPRLKSSQAYLTQPWRNKQIVNGKLTNTGAYIFEPAVLDYIPPRTPFDISQDLLPRLIKAGLRVETHKMTGYWNALDTFEDYRKAQHIFLHSGLTPHSGTLKTFQYLSVPNKPLNPGVWIGRNSLIHPTSNLIPPVYIGENCRVGRHAEIGPEAVLGNNVIVDDEASIGESTILDGTYIGRLVRVENRVVHKNLVIDIPSETAVQIVDEHIIAPTLQSVYEGQLMRAIDPLIALFVLLLSLPLAFPLVLLLKLLNGRVFAPAKRVLPPARQGIATGDNGKTKSFDLLQFSTARANEDESAQPLNRFLKRWDLYRLPELWNVVRGDMRLVGVKPISAENLLSLNNRLAAGEDWCEKIYECPAGFTGFWFVQAQPWGFPEEELIADAYYAAVHNWKTDLAILSQTPAAWYRRVKHNATKKPSPLRIAKEEGS